jgi:methionyl-tRNA synthetase
MSKPFYITTTLPYVNSEPHIGFAMEVIRADIVARYKKLKGFEVFFNTGTDEHGMKIWKKAKEEGVAPKEYVDSLTQKFKDLQKILNLSPDLNFIRTTDSHHEESAKAFWLVCWRNGYIYKKNYQIKYCVGCELEKTESELEDGRCPLHPNGQIETIEEENYFFKFSAFQKPLMEFYAINQEFVVPDFRFNEIKAFVKRGLQDFSISRLKAKMPWGIEVPNDPDHVMYVWFDALVNYVSAIGWPFDMTKFKKWGIDSGGMVQYCGKDNLRQQSAMWQAMLMAAGLPNSQKIVINGFITGEGGIKMSKSLGNVTDPVEIVSQYGADALRYFLAREISPFEDSPFTKEGFKKSYNANLANGLGNLVSRVLTMATNNGVSGAELRVKDVHSEYEAGFENYDLKKALDVVWNKIQDMDKTIQETAPFKLVKNQPDKAKEIIRSLLKDLLEVASKIEPFMPETAARIQAAILNNTKPGILFPKKE